MTPIDETLLDAASFPALSMGASTGAAPRAAVSLKAQPIVLPRAATVLEGFRQVAESCLRQFLDNRAAFLNRRAPEHVHQMRVAIRRLRSLLSFHKRLLDAGTELRLRRRLKQVFGLLGRAREFDVLLEQVHQGTIGPIDRNAMQRLRSARMHAYERAEQLLRSRRLEKLVASLRRWLAGQPLDAAGAVAPLKLHARHVLRRQLRGLRRFDELDALPVEDMHRLRIRAKKLRYACDFFQSSFVRSPKAAMPLVKPLQKLQDVLGAFNDLETIGAMAATLGTRPATPHAHAHDLKYSRKLRRRSAKALHSVLGAERFWKSA